MAETTTKSQPLVVQHSRAQSNVPEWWIKDYKLTGKMWTNNKALKITCQQQKQRQ